MSKLFKDVRSQTRPSPSELVALARAQDPSVPPAVVNQPAAPDAPPSEELVQLNVRVQRALADQLADAAVRDRVSQRAIICRALRDAGFSVNETDLADRVVRRRRGTRSSD